MDGQLVRIDLLPTKGIMYPDDIEIYVRPLGVKEQIDMDRYGISQAEYFQKVLDGVTIKGVYDKNNMYFHDVQFLDLVRRLYTFDINEEIQTTEYPCMYRDCKGTVDYSFTFEQINYTELEKEIFGKEFTFSDGMEVVVSPITIKDFIKMTKKYTSNKNSIESDIYVAYFVYTIKEIKDREFESIDKRNEFLFDYIGKICNNKDKKILDEIEAQTVSVVHPFEVICPECGRITEVVVKATTRFQQ